MGDKNVPFRCDLGRLGYLLTENWWKSTRNHQKLALRAPYERTHTGEVVQKRPPSRRLDRACFWRVSRPTKLGGPPKFGPSPHPLRPIELSKSARRPEYFLCSPLIFCVRPFKSKENRPPRERPDPAGCLEAPRVVSRARLLAPRTVPLWGQCSSLVES